MRRADPPRFIMRILKWFCKPEYHADIEGDLLEIYDRRVADLGRSQANLRLYKDVILLLQTRNSQVRNIRSTTSQ